MRTASVAWSPGMTDFMAKPVRPDVLYETVLRGLMQPI
jgi:FixJ family two-component response regulator